MFSSSKSTDGKILKEGRLACYQARDTFYECVKQCGYIFTPDTPVPDKCKKLRAAYESSCLSSWVKHFDEQQLQQARAAKNVHAAINQQAVRAAGTLAGKS